MKNIATLLIILCTSLNPLSAQLPDSTTIREQGIREIQSWVIVFKYQHQKDSQLFEIRKYDSLGNETYMWQDLSVYGWGVKQELQRKFEGYLPTEELLIQNGDKESLTLFRYDKQNNLKRTDEIYYKYNDTVETHNQWFYNNAGKPDSMHAMRVGNYRQDTARFYTYYTYDSLDRETSVKTLNQKGAWLNQTVNTWNGDGKISEYSEETFGEKYSYHKYYYSFYEDGKLAGYTDDNNNTYEYYYDYRGLMYYMLYVDRLGDPNAGYYYIYTFQEP